MSIKREKEKKIGNVTVNLSYYDGSDRYSDGDIEDHMLEIAKNAVVAQDSSGKKTERLNAVIKEEKNWAVLYHFSHIRENIMEPAEITKDMHVLEIGSGCGAITGAIAKKAKKVTCVELSRKRSMINAYKNSEYDNIEILVGNFQDIEKDLETYDMITLIGVFEYARGYIAGENPYQNFLNKVVHHLQPDGQLVLAIENKLGLKYFAGCCEDHTGEPFEGIENYVEDKGVRTFSKKELTGFIEKAGFSDIRYFYPYPDYKLPYEFYTEKRLPKAGELHTNMRNFDRDRYVFFDEGKAYQSILDAGLYEEFSNSFLVVAKKEKVVSQKEDYKIIYKKCSNDRDLEYAIFTDICQNASGDRRVEKYACLSGENLHIQHMVQMGEKLDEMFHGTKLKICRSHMDGNKAVMDYVTGETLEDRLDSLLSKGDVEGVKNELGSLVDILLEKCSKPFVLTEKYQEVFGNYVPEQTMGCMSVTDIDLLPANILCMEDDWVVIDYEWTFDFPVPVEFAIYRLLYMYIHSGDLRRVLRIYDFMDFSAKNLQIFEQMEKNFQTYISKKIYPIWKMYGEFGKDAHDPVRSVELIVQSNQRLKQERDAILNSSAWRLTKPLRTTADRLKSLRFKTKNMSAKEKISAIRNAVRRQDRGKKFVEKAVAVNKDVLRREAAQQFKHPVLFSIVVPLYNTPEKYLRAMIASCRMQSYRKWELCLADGSDEEHAYVGDVVRELQEKDKRIRYKKLEKNDGISENTNRALEMAKGEYIGLLDHDDLLHPSALYQYMKVIEAQKADFIYCDELTFEKVLKNAVTIHLKPDFAPDNLLANNYICHFSVFSKQLLEKTGGFRKEFDGSQDHDMILRLTSKAEHVVHVPRILYFWRSHANSVSQDISSKTYAVDAGKKAVKMFLEDQGIAAEVSSTRAFPTIYRIRYQIKEKPLVSILIPNKDNLEMLKSCLNSIKKSTYPNYEIVIVENNSKEKKTFEFYKSLAGDKKVKVAYYPEEGFNYSAINNFGLGVCEGQYIIFLNNDINIITPEWIEELLMYAQRENAGAVGAKLYFEDDTVQHAGIILGMGLDRCAGVLHFRFSRDSVGVMGRLSYAQDFSAVTAACMMVDKKKFQEAGGFDEKLAVAYNDVDLCLKLREAGYVNIWTPFCEAYHFESVSRGSDMSGENRKRLVKEAEYFKNKWKKVLEKGDPYYHPALSLDHSDFSIK